MTNNFDYNLYHDEKLTFTINFWNFNLSFFMYFQ